MDYWRQRNKSNAYSKKLNELFKESIKIILDFPQIGKGTHEIIYEETETQIFILTIWDSRQDPDKKIPR